MIQAKEIMNHLVSKGIFEKNHLDGLPLKNFLKHLDDNHHTHLIPQIHCEVKLKNKNWFFIRPKVKASEPAPIEALPDEATPNEATPDEA